jgi:hypothetical protein
VLLAAHLAVTWYLTGVIWLVQLVHYPMMGRTGAAFNDCQKFHLGRMGIVVGPAMLIEAATAVALLWRYPDSSTLRVAAALLVVIWASTFGLQVPRHNRLSRGFDRRAHTELVRTNWIRTVSWTVRAFVLSSCCALQ